MSFNFGSTSTAAPATSSGFNFGSSATTTTPATSGFSFGTPSTSTAPSSTSFSLNTSSTPSLTVSTAPAPTINAFSFPSTTTQPTTAPAATTSFSFGPNPTAPSTRTSFSFGTNPTVPSTGTFALSTTPTTPITMETLFSTLPTDIQKNIISFHTFLKEQDRLETFLKSVSSQPLKELETSLNIVQQYVLIQQNRQNQQITNIQQIRSQMQQLIHQVDQATLTLRTQTKGEKEKGHLYYNIIRNNTIQPSLFYSQLIQDFESRMFRIKESIQVMENELSFLSSSSSSSSTIDTSLIQSILIRQQQSLIHMAQLVAIVHQETENMRQLYLNKIKEDLKRHGDITTFKNPFEKKKKKDSSHWYEIDAIRFKTSVAPTIMQSSSVPAPQTTGGFSTTTMNVSNTISNPFKTTGTSLFPIGTSATTASTPSITPIPASSTVEAPKTVSFGFNAPPPVTTSTTTPFSLSGGDGTGGIGEKRTLSGTKSGVRGRTRKR